MVVLALIERANVAVGDLPAQDWALRVTLVYQRNGSEWHLVTATLATYFVGRDAEAEDGELAGAKAIAELKSEIKALRIEISKLPQRGGRQKT